MSDVYELLARAGILFDPFHAYVTCTPAPDIANLGKARVKLFGTDGDTVTIATPETAWDKNHMPNPNTGRWYRVLTLPSPCTIGVQVGDIVCCNLSFRSHLMSIGGLNHALFSEQFVVSRLIKDDRMKTLDHHPLGKHVLTRRNDQKHLKIIRAAQASGAILVPETTLKWGQKTSEVMAMDPREQAQREADYQEKPPERENDGVRVHFEEVIAVTDDSRCKPGDMVAFKRLAATVVEFMGVTLHAVPYTAQVGRVPAECFADEYKLSPSDFQLRDQALAS